MLSKITILTCLSFAVLYPLCFLISARDPLKNKFHKFHLGIANIVGGVVLVFILLSDFPVYIKVLISLWKIIFFTLSRVFWKKDFPHPYIIASPSILGVITLISLQFYLVSESWQIATIAVLAGLVYVCAWYAMNLGHFYLNVHGLPVKHLRWAINVFLGCLVLRLLWDIFILATTRVVYAGEEMPLLNFTGQMDGIFLWIALFFGTLFPLGSLYFAYGTLKLKNTQATTGILYVILSAVLLGDLAYKYYLIKYFIPL